MTLTLFWAAAAVVTWTYVGFPMVTLARAVVRPRPHRHGEITPHVSVVIAAHNEAHTIGAKLENLLALDYPSDRIEAVVASDGSDDGTEDVVRGYADRGVTLVALPRVGKAEALNAAIAASSGEIVVFSDANSIFAATALRALVRPFADPDVGGVAGDQSYLEPGADPDGLGRGERRYWSFDRLLKRAQSRSGNATSATGAIYAVRRSLIPPVPEGVTDDFVTSTAVISHGHRLVFTTDATAFEPVAPSGRLEFERKVRVITRGLRGVAFRRELLDPRRHGYYSLQLFSHKVLRRLMPFPLVTLAVAGFRLRHRGPMYRAASAAQVAVYGLGGVGLAAARHPLGRLPVLSLPAYFLMVNVAALKATWNVLTGQRINRWEPRRDTDEAPDRRRVA